MTWWFLRKNIAKVLRKVNSQHAYVNTIFYINTHGSAIMFRATVVGKLMEKELDYTGYTSST